MRSVVDLNALGERTVMLDCDVIQADGGTRTASITGAFVALALALRQLVDYGVLRTMPLRDYVAATSVGLVRGVPMLDLCYEEDSQADVDMNVVMTGAGRFVEVQATAEHTPFDDAQMAQLLALARGGIAELVEIQKKVARTLIRLLLRHRQRRQTARIPPGGAAPAPGARSRLLPDFKTIPPCVEDGATFDENAIIKARHYARSRDAARCSRTIPAW